MSNKIPAPPINHQSWIHVAESMGDWIRDLQPHELGNRIIIGIHGSNILGKNPWSTSTEVTVAQVLQYAFIEGLESRTMEDDMEFHNIPGHYQKVKPVVLPRNDEFLHAAIYLRRISPDKKKWIKRHYEEHSAPGGHLEKYKSLEDYIFEVYLSGKPP